MFYFLNLVDCQHFAFDPCNWRSCFKEDDFINKFLVAFIFRAEIIVKTIYSWVRCCLQSVWNVKKACSGSAEKSENNGYEWSPKHNQRNHWWRWYIDWLMSWIFFVCFGVWKALEQNVGQNSLILNKTAANWGCSGFTNWYQRRSRITKTCYNITGD